MDFSPYDDVEIWHEENLTTEMLIKEYERIIKEEPHNTWKYEICDYCKQPKKVYFNTVEGSFGGESFYAINKEKHKNCSQIMKYEKLSIFDKYHKENIFSNSVPKNDIEKSYLESFKKYCDNFEKAKEIGVGLLLTGNAGTGKTFYSNCISNELKSKGFTVLSFNISGYMQELKKEFKEEQLLESIKSVDLVIIDDVGSEVLSEFTKEKMFNLFNTIYLEKKPCIVTTNNNARELEEHFRINGSGKILDRLLELCKPFKFDWKSRRQEIGQEKFKDLF